jgi:WD40 repeat protein
MLQVRTIFLLLSGLIVLQWCPQQANPAPTSPAPRAQELRFDQYGAVLPEGALQRLGNVRENRYSINSVAISPDGRLAALANGDGLTYLWNLASAREVRRLRGHLGQVMGVAFCPDGTTLASGGYDHTVRLWNVATGNEICCFRGHSKRVTSLAFSPNGKLVASGSWDNTVRVWGVDTGNLRLTLDARARVIAVAFSPDGRMLASGGYVDDAPGAVGLWDVTTGQEWFRFGLEHRAVNAVAFSPDGWMLASANDCDSIDLWEVASGNLICTLTGHTGYIKSVVFSPDGRFLASTAAGAGDQTIRLWEVASGQECRRFPGSAESSDALAFTPDGRALVSGGRDTTALIWAVRDAPGKRSLSTLSRPKLDALWQDLQRPDAAQGQEAIRRLIADPESSVAFLGQTLRPGEEPLRHVAKFIVDLDSPRFQVRSRAMHELERLGRLAVPALRRSLKSPSSLETSRRIQLLLLKIGPYTVPAEWLRTLRSLQVLENLDTPEARQVLHRLAQGPTEASLTREARAVLQRVDRRVAVLRRPPPEP